MVKERLQLALQKQLDDLEEKKKELKNEQKEAENNARKMSKADREKLEQEQDHMEQRFGRTRRKKTLQEQERDLHEAYQIILAEYHNRVKGRMKKQLRKMHLVKKLTEPMVNPDTTG